MADPPFFAETASRGPSAMRNEDASTKFSAETVSLGRRVVGNSIVQFVPPVVRMLLGLALTAALSRYLGVTAFGEYALVFAYVAAFSGVFNDAGLGTILLREISQRPSQRGELLTSAAALQACLAAGSYVLIVAGLFVLSYSEAVKQAAALFGLSVLLTPLDLLALTFQADLRLSKLLPPSLSGLALNFALSTAVIVLHGSLLLLFAAAFTALVVQSLWTLRLSLRVIQLEHSGLTRHWRGFLTEAWPLWCITVASSCFVQAPLLILSAFNVEWVGIYNAANKLPAQALILPLAIRNSTFPTLAHSWVNDRERFSWLVERLVRAMVIIVLPGAVLSAGLASSLIEVLFGSAFADANLPFVLLVCVQAVLCPTLLVGEALVAAGRQRLNLAIQIAVIPVLLVLLFCLVPLAGATGAAVAVLIAYAGICVGTFGVAIVVLRQRSLLRVLPWVALASGVGACVLLLPREMAPILSGPKAPWLISPLAALLTGCILVLAQRDYVRELLAFLGVGGVLRRDGA